MKMTRNLHGKMVLLLIKAQIVATFTSDSSRASIAALKGRIEALQGPCSCIIIQADLRDPATSKLIVEETIQAFGQHIDILVNNAAAEMNKPLEEVTIEDFDYIFHLNVRAPLLLTTAVKKYLRTGRIINISSVGSRTGFANFSLYSSSKAGLEGLTRSMAAELGRDGHTVNTVNPGPVQSDMLDNIPKDIVSMQKANTPIENRLGTVDDVAQIVAWLASEESRWITGQCISASGGYALY